MKALSRLPKALRALVASVEDDSDSNDDAFDSGRSYWVSLVPGWHWEDCHVIHAGSLKDIREALESAQACDCKECHPGVKT